MTLQIYMEQTLWHDVFVYGSILLFVTAYVIPPLLRGIRQKYRLTPRLLDRMGYRESGARRRITERKNGGEE